MNSGEHTSAIAPIDTPESLYELMLAPIKWQIINVALELALFDRLSTPITNESLAQCLSLQPDKTLLLLKALCSLGIVEHNAPYFLLKKSLSPYLTTASEHSMCDMLLHLSKTKHTSNHNVIDILKTGNAQHISANLDKADFWKNSVANLRSFHQSMGTNTAMSLLQALPQWAKASSLLDLGAGSSYLAEQILNQRSDIEITLFDLPECIRAFRPLASAQQKQITLLPGDVNSDPLGGGYSIIWSSMTLYYAKDLVSVLTKIKQALNPNGVFISLHEGLDHQRTQPQTHVLGRFIPAMNGHDVSFDKGVIAQKMQLAGFTQISSQTIATPYGEMQMDIGNV